MPKSREACPIIDGTAISRCYRAVCLKNRLQSIQTFQTALSFARHSSSLSSGSSLIRKGVISEWKTPARLDVILQLTLKRKRVLLLAGNAILVGKFLSSCSHVRIAIFSGRAGGVSKFEGLHTIQRFRPFNLLSAAAAFHTTANHDFAKTGHYFHVSDSNGFKPGCALTVNCNRRRFHRQTCF